MINDIKRTHDCSKTSYGGMRLRTPSYLPTRTLLPPYAHPPCPSLFTPPPRYAGAQPLRFCGTGMFRPPKKNITPPSTHSLEERKNSNTVNEPSKNPPASWKQKAHKTVR